MARTRISRPPAAHQDFVSRFPKLGEAWSLVAEAGKTGPLDEHATRLIKLGIAAGAMREGAVHAAVRKALDAGASQQEIEQVVALSAGTLGFPATVAVHSWTRDVLGAMPTKAHRQAKATR
jgi:alkylhydroperoxidase/carboxymuconolactone decarboxylase family protein YurZ